MMSSDRDAVAIVELVFWPLCLLATVFVAHHPRPTSIFTIAACQQTLPRHRTAILSSDCAILFTLTLCTTLALGIISHRATLASPSYPRFLGLAPSAVSCRGPPSPLLAAGGGGGKRNRAEYFRVPRRARG
ncbi:hypothetical protein F4775DRAFT_605388 [Biscogniauxia sp. FL1348]|nr:hypothetical protein F4775DRAFT_605388 [Biscogniauxia sp. FL1348]